MIVFFAVGCQTDQPTPAIIKFVETNYAPTNEQEVRNKVTAFLSHVNSGDISFRNTFPDTEINEARWTLEGSANYVANVNHPNHTVTNAKSYTLLINNTTVNGELRMIGSDMTSKFSSLLTDIQTEENQSGKVAMAVDMKLNSVSGTESEVEARVVYGEDTGNGSTATITWQEAAIEVTGEINAQIPDIGVGCWSPEVNVYFWFDNESIVSHHSIDIQQFVKGNYFYTIRDGNVHLQVGKVVKE